MPHLGLDCQIILDGHGYFVEPGSYHMSRLRNATVYRTPGAPAPANPASPAAVIDSGLPPPGPQGGGSPTRIVDRGPNMRTWTMTILCRNDLKRYDGSMLGATGQRLRDQLQTSYDKVATILPFTDPAGSRFGVTFAQYAERVLDLRTQRVGLDYLVEVVLIESE